MSHMIHLPANDRSRSTNPGTKRANQYTLAGYSVLRPFRRKKSTEKRWLRDNNSAVNGEH